MSTRFLISDHHFRHANMYRFTDSTGARVRPWAETADEADEMMIDAWNRTVGPRDTVYHLGDVAIARTGVALLGRLNGRIILVRGNHDIFKMKDYLPYVADIRGTHKKDRFLLSHYPLHPDSLPPWCLGCVHGHTHGAHVIRTDANGTTTRDPRYLNVCVEPLTCIPISFEEAAARLTRARAEAGWDIPGAV